MKQALVKPKGALPAREMAETEQQARGPTSTRTGDRRRMQQDGVRRSRRAERGNRKR